MTDWFEPRGSAVEPVRARGRGAAAKEPDKAPDKATEVHNATTRVTIAWPFSQIKLQEASAELAELAGLMSDLIDALSDFVPEDRLGPLRDRATSLRARLH
jgi:hypothetical protein